MTQRVAIVGGPKTGKTTLANGYKDTHIIHHTDDLIELGWSAASDVASWWFDLDGDHVVEGVAVPRALRKWLARNPTGKPCDKVIVLTHAWEEVSKGQRAMTKGVMTVLDEILDDLIARGVEIVGR